MGLMLSLKDPSGSTRVCYNRLIPQTCSVQSVFSLCHLLSISFVWCPLLYCDITRPFSSSYALGAFQPVKFYIRNHPTKSDRDNSIPHQDPGFFSEVFTFSNTAAMQSLKFLHHPAAFDLLPCQFRPSLQPHSNLVAMQPVLGDISTVSVLSLA